MALLNFDRNMPIGEIKADFRRETGRALILYQNNNAVNDSMLFGKLLKLMHTYAEYKDHYSHNTFQLYSFYPLETVINLKNGLFDRYGITIDVADENGRILADGERLCVDNEKRPKPNYMKLAKINETLMRIERDIHNRWKAEDPNLYARMTTKRGWMRDYEIEADIRYYIDGKDPICRIASGLLVKQNVLLDKKTWNEDEMDTRYDWTCERPFPKTYKTRQCYLYHDLHDHHGIVFNDIERIGDISVDFHIIQQNNYTLKQR